MPPNCKGSSSSPWRQLREASFDKTASVRFWRVRIAQHVDCQLVLVWWSWGSLRSRWEGRRWRGWRDQRWWGGGWEVERVMVAHHAIVLETGVRYRGLQIGGLWLWREQWCHEGPWTNFSIYKVPIEVDEFNLDPSDISLIPSLHVGRRGGLSIPSKESQGWWERGANFKRWKE